MTGNSSADGEAAKSRAFSNGGADGDAYPTFCDGVILYARATVIGRCAVGNNVIFGSGAMVINTDVPNDSVVVGQYPAHRRLPNRESVRDLCFAREAEARR